MEYNDMDEESDAKFYKTDEEEEQAQMDEDLSLAHKKN